MKSLNKITLLLAFAFGISVSIISPACSQQNDLSGGLESVQRSAIESSEALPIETALEDGDAFFTPTPAVDEITSTYPSDPVDCETCEANVVMDQHLFPEVKNVNFFGVDREKCCDEWAGLCKCKTLNYGCGCGGLKANKGHLGVRWLKSRYGAEECDYCNGGCCGNERGGIRSERKAAFNKLLGKKSRSCNDQKPQGSIFGRPLKENCDRCGCGCEDCGPEEECSSCK